MRKGENVAKDQPKITGLSFNLFAIVSVFILLPISTAWISTLANANTDELDDITTNYHNEMAVDPQVCPFQISPSGAGNSITFEDAFSMTWLDKGLNSTNEYMQRDGNPSNEVDRFESIYDPNSGINYHQMGTYCSVANYMQRDNQVFQVGVDNHRWLNSNHYIHGNNPNYAGYIGYSGDEYSFRINGNTMKWIDGNRDISVIKISFIDYHTGFSCDNPVFQQVTTIGDIRLKFNNAFDGLLYENFRFDQVNSYKVGFAPSNVGGIGVQNMNDFCHIGLEFEFDFDPIESIEISEYFQNDYDSMALEITLRDFEFDNVTAANITVGASNAPIPFTGDDNFGFNFQVGYVDTTRTNFFLNGGTFLMGVGLFALAIANTPYWNPVVNFFRPRGA